MGASLYTTGPLDVADNSLDVSSGGNCHPAIDRYREGGPGIYGIARFRIFRRDGALQRERYFRPGGDRDGSECVGWLTASLRQLGASLGSSRFLGLLRPCSHHSRAEQRHHQSETHALPPLERNNPEWMQK